MFGLRTEGLSAQQSARRAILQPGPAFLMKQTARDTHGTTLTFGTLHDDINELCLRFMRLSLKTSPTSAKDGPHNTVSAQGKLLKPKPAQLLKHTANPAGYACGPFKGVTTGLYTHGSQLSQEQRAMQRAAMRFSQLPAATKDSPLNKKRKLDGESEQNNRSQPENLGDKSQGEFTPNTKKRCKGWPVFPASLHAKSLSPTKANGNKQAPLSCTPAPSLPAKQQELKESSKTDGLNAGKDETFHPEAPPQKHAEGEKPSGKRKCKTKHLEAQGRRKRSFLAMDDPFEIQNIEDTVTVPRKVRKQAEPASHCASSPAKPYQQKLRRQLQQPPSLPTPRPAVLQADSPRQPMPPEACSISFDEDAGETLLQRAACLGYETVVLYCLQNKVCDVNHHDIVGYCALHEACANGWLSIARLLLEYGADVNCSTHRGTRPIHNAVHHDYLDIVRLLLSYGADPTLPTHSGKTILEMTRSKLMKTFLTEYFADLQRQKPH